MIRYFILKQNNSWVEVNDFDDAYNKKGMGDIIAISAVVRLEKPKKHILDETIIKLKKEGYTFQAIADEFGLSKARIHQIYHAKETKKTN